MKMLLLYLLGALSMSVTIVTVMALRGAFDKRFPIIRKIRMILFGIAFVFGLIAIVALMLRDA